MNTIQLPRNVQFLYEEHLARLEFAALGCHELNRAGDHWDQMTGVVNGTTDMMLARISIPRKSRRARFCLLGANQTTVSGGTI